MCCPILCAAQSEWEIPNAEKPSREVKKEKKTPKDANAETAKENIKDWEYIKEGAVPEVDGKVVFTYDIDMPGKSAQVILSINSLFAEFGHSRDYLRALLVECILV